MTKLVGTSLATFSITKWSNLIKSCISSVKHYLLINGCISESVLPNRGIRQGDPMFPYLFLLCMEVLTQIINKNVATNKWSPVKIKDIKLSHLLYADDVLLFAKVNKKTIKAINSSLKDFMSFSGLNINLSKSSIWFSPNTPSHTRASTSLSLGIREHPNP